MKISIVTPTYNQGRFLPTCIRSVLGQSHWNLEHIIIDGGSTDDTVSVLRAASQDDNRLRYISEPDYGQGSAVNKGFGMVQGDIVGWINSDDFYYANDVFEFVATFFRENPSVDLLYGGLVYVDEKNYVEHIRIPPRFNRDRLVMISYIGNTNAFFRRTIIEKHQTDENCHFVIDHEFMLRVTRDFRVERTPRIIACFRVHNNSKTQLLPDAFKDKERLYRDIKNDIRRGAFSKIRLLIYRIMYKISLYYTDLKYLRGIRKTLPFRTFTDH